MIEFTLTEIVFMVWAALATASWLSAREEARMSNKMVLLFIENKEVREQVLKAHEEFLRKQGDKA